MQVPHTAPLQSHHLADARLFATRFDQMIHLRQLLHADGITAPSILEIGVGFGWFSKFLIEAFVPSRFAGIDVFQFHTYDELWGVNVAEQLKGRTHVDYYRDELSAVYAGDLVIEQGDSGHLIPRFADGSFDIVYVDAGHTYEEVLRDGLASLPKVRPGGYIVFNDYIMYDHRSGIDYGVVQAVSEIINADDRLKVIGFALDPQMFCDLAVRIVA